jgi:integrase
MIPREGGNRFSGDFKAAWRPDDWQSSARKSASSKPEFAEEYEQMLTAGARTSANAPLVVLLRGDAGLRGGELRALEWTDVNLQKCQLRVERNDWRGEVTSTKGNRVRYVPLTRRLAGALKQYRHLRGKRVLCREHGRPLAEYHLADLLAKVGRRANVRSNDPHTLRHYAASRTITE